jgi:hypothetical protein
MGLARKISVLTVGVISFAICPTLHAAQYPFQFFQEQNIDNHQVGHVKIDIDDQGTGKLEGFWSNGQKINGNTFYAIVALADKDRNVIWSDKETKGLDGSWFGHAREGTVTKDFTLNKDQMNALDHVVFKLGVLNCGLELKEFHCCNNGIEVALGTKKCEGSDTPSPPRVLRPGQM